MNIDFGEICFTLAFVVVGLGIWSYLANRGKTSSATVSVPRPAGGSRPNMQVSNSAALRDPQVQAFIASNQKINAIKRYRELTGSDLKTAKDAIDRAAANPSAMPVGDPSAALATPTAAPPTPVKLNAADEVRIRDLIRSGDKIAAIKAYREVTGTGLKEAKDTIDAMAKDIMF